MTPRRGPLPPLLAVLALLAIVFGASACAHSGEETEVVEGEPVTLGELQYNAVFSRFLNPHDSEDSAYLAGRPQPPRGFSYLGVFFEIQNESKGPQTLVRSMSIHDAGGRAFEAIPSESLYALPFGGRVGAEEQVPELDSTAQQGPIQGSLALFLLPDSALENRPLILEIPGPGGPAEVLLDL